MIQIMSLADASGECDPIDAGIELAWQANAAYDVYVATNNQLERWKRMHDEALIDLTLPGRDRMTAEAEAFHAVFDELMERAGVLIGPGTAGGAVLESEA